MEPAALLLAPCLLPSILTNLFIEGDLRKLHDLSGSMSAILVRCWFTKLRSLILAKKYFEGYDLLEFSSEIHHC